MLITLLYILFFTSCVALVATVLLQPGKTDAGALFTSSVSSTAFGARGTATLLSKITIGAAATFMLSALLIAMPALSGNVSVLDTVSETKTETPKTDANSNTSANTADANANANANVSSNAPANVAPANAVTNAAPSNAASVKKEEVKKEEPKKEQPKNP
jgi:preprotein translocase subunit SecG